MWKFPTFDHGFFQGVFIILVLNITTNLFNHCFFTTSVVFNTTSHCFHPATQHRWRSLLAPGLCGWRAWGSCPPEAAPGNGGIITLAKNRGISWGSFTIFLTASTSAIFSIKNCEFIIKKRGDFTCFHHLRMDNSLLPSAANNRMGCRRPPKNREPQLQWLNQQAEWSWWVVYWIRDVNYVNFDHQKLGVPLGGTDVTMSEH